MATITIEVSDAEAEALKSVPEEEIRDALRLLLSPEETETEEDFTPQEWESLRRGYAQAVSGEGVMSLEEFRENWRAGCAERYAAHKASGGK